MSQAQAVQASHEVRDAIAAMNVEPVANGAIAVAGDMAQGFVAPLENPAVIANQVAAPAQDFVAPLENPVVNANQVAAPAPANPAVIATPFNAVTFAPLPAPATPRAATASYAVEISRLKNEEQLLATRARQLNTDQKVVDLQEKVIDLQEKVVNLHETCRSMQRQLNQLLGTQQQDRRDPDRGAAVQASKRQKLAAAGFKKKPADPAAPSTKGKVGRPRKNPETVKKSDKASVSAAADSDSDGGPGSNDDSLDTCGICHQSDDGKGINKTIYCDGDCAQAFHLRCIRPASFQEEAYRVFNTTSNWYCVTCTHHMKKQQKQKKNAEEDHE